MEKQIQKEKDRLEKLTKTFKQEKNYKVKLSIIQEINMLKKEIKRLHEQTLSLIK